MDGERQPLLAPTASDIQFRNYRPLSYDDVLASRSEVPWRRARFGLVLMFWAMMAIFLSLIVSLIIKHNCSKDLGSLPTVPPVHISFTPLIS